MARGLVGLLPVLLALWARTAHAGGLDVKDWLARPGVRLVAVEFFATWCEPCMKAVPRWKALHEKYREQGLRLVVVSTQDPDGSCLNPGWNPDDVVCDTEGAIADAYGTAGKLPAAFLWSWQGHLLVRAGHVAEVEAGIDGWLASTPRVLVETGELASSIGVKKSELEELVRGELRRQDKVQVVATEVERKQLADIVKKSYGAGMDEKLQCKIGEDLSANALLKVSIAQSKPQRLSLSLLSAERKCLVANATVDVSAARLTTNVAEAVAELTQKLRPEVQLPRGLGVVAKKFEEQRIQDPGADSWSAETQSEKLGLVKFESSPPGAKLLVDGQVVCDKTPCQRAVLEGRHEVAMLLEQHEAKTQRADLQDGRGVSWSLAPTFGTLTVRSDPSGLEVSVDGERRGRTPVEGLRVSEGPHEVLLDERCHHRAGERFELKRGQSKTLELAPKPRKAGLWVSAKDDDGNDLRATVSLDGRELGATLATYTVPLCAEELRVRAPGLGAWTLPLGGPKLREQQLARVSAVLGPSGRAGDVRELRFEGSSKAESAESSGTNEGSSLVVVRFESRPDGAAVMLDGKATCTATPCSRALVPGGHTVAMMAERYVRREESVSLDARRPDLRWELEPDFGTLSVTTEPPGLHVLLDGQDAGVTPLAGREVSSGPHEVRVSDKCFFADGKRLSVERGKRHDVTLELKPRPAGLRVTAKDSSGEDVRAEVKVDGKVVGVTPGTFTVPVCGQVVMVEHKEKGAFEQALALTEKQTHELRATLSRDAPKGSGASGAKGMALIPAGEFWMGCSRKDSRCEDDEKPGREVYLDAFLIDRTEVTVGRYDECVRAGTCLAAGQAAGCNSKGHDHPVVCVDWEQASAFCRWAGGALPTEAQWEKAARGTDSRIYPWGEQTPTCDRAKYSGCGSGGTKPVASHPAGANGLFDMAGNVWEWVEDVYDAQAYSRLGARNPVSTSGGSARVARGGSWSDGDDYVRASDRDGNGPGYRLRSLGFRCARPSS
ncbi:MAG: SUMF1/EgtB/PvdO family nonheme iron enzyme [Deltaproteobacteria bacterium]|nr:SUMF1/EgtB/PvdO family nonheme iron enzyme [Deltaproteobacteria bacterium]